MKSLQFAICIAFATIVYAAKAPKAPKPPPVLGVALVNLVAIGGSSGQNVSTSAESNLADMFCEAIVGKPTANFTVCLINGGSFSANIPMGNITQSTLNAVYPYNDTVVELLISGNTLSALLQTGVQSYPNKGGFPQVQNIRYSFLPVPNFQSDTGYATRIVNSQLINGSSVYGIGGDSPSITLVTNSYLANGGDGYNLKGAQVISNSTLPLVDVVAQYIKTQQAVGAQPDGRIVNCSNKASDPFCAAQSSAGNAGASSNGQYKPTSSAAHTQMSLVTCALVLLSISTINF